ncbi:MAG: DUF1593 domain-containing protein, partial [Planctomyces sp.]
MLRKLLLILLVPLPVCCLPATNAQQQRPRLAVLTDIGGDPDDQQSLIRLMLYTNELDVRLLIASAAGTVGELKEAVTRPELIREIVEAFGQVRPQLLQHAKGWPTAEELLSRTCSGNQLRGRMAVGEQFDTDASRRLLQEIDAATPEDPLNISIWGGQTDFAQALWRAKQSKTPAEFQQFCRSFRVYDINDQDSLADWIRSEFPGLFYIL